jgi:hypothetical protein
MKYTVYVKSVNSDSTETQNWKRNRNYFKTRAHSSVDKGFRICEDLGEPYRIPYIYNMILAAGRKQNYSGGIWNFCIG